MNAIYSLQVFEVEVVVVVVSLLPAISGISIQINNLLITIPLNMLMIWVWWQLYFYEMYLLEMQYDSQLL